MDLKKQFDVLQFNKDFEAKKEAAKELVQERVQERLNELNRVDDVKKLYDLSILDIIIGIKDAWFELLDDLLEQNFSLSTFTRQNRLFYIGLTILLIASTLYVYYMIFEDKPLPPPQENRIIHVYHTEPNGFNGFNGLSVLGINGISNGNNE